MVDNFDFEIFANGALLQTTPSSSTEERGGLTSFDEDMAPYTMFQRFCVLLLSIHGQVDKYQSPLSAANNGSSEEASKQDTTEFLKNLNVYNGIMYIDKTI